MAEEKVTSGVGIIVTNSYTLLNSNN